MTNTTSAPASPASASAAFTDADGALQLGTTPQHDALRAIAHELATYSQIGALLSWDRETMLRSAGVEARARQESTLAAISHKRSTADDVRSAIEAVEDIDPTSPEARVMRREFDLATKLPTEFVRDLVESTAIAGEVWQRARANNDFAVFAPHLEHIVELNRRAADYFGYETEAWDARADNYEEGMRAADVERIIGELREPIRELIEQQSEPDVSILQRSYPIAAQREYCEFITRAIGFNFDAGRFDVTAHPFCSTMGPHDVRLTTRYDEHWLPASVLSIVHEAGHGIYEQSFARLGVTQPLADAPGLGTHESQSRMYENIIGRSIQFWRYYYPSLQKAFPGALGDVSLEDFHRSINTAQPSLIRVEADELTYNLHIALRFELERALINGTMTVAELPEAWREAMRTWLGVVPDTDTDGVLQDVHWSLGSFGYFPTYMMGNVYAAQFFEACRSAIPDLDDQIERGDLSALKAWFDRNVYRYGCAFTGVQLVENATGGPVSAEPLVRYLRSKFGADAAV